MDDPVPARLSCLLIAGGKFHDIDFARLELLKLLSEDERIRTRVFEDYENLDAIRAADFIISYTCDVVPSLAAQEALRAWLAQGRRWYALHGTNSILRWLENGKIDAPDWAPLFMETLGSQFVAHPPIAPYMVQVANRDHPLAIGLEDFETDDELYLVRTHGELDVILKAEFEGRTDSFAKDVWEKSEHPVLYISKVGGGAVLYNTLGHCRGHYDLQPLMDYWPTVERCAWNLDIFYTLLRRGIGWAMEPVA